MEEVEFSEESNTERAALVKYKRKQLRAKITRTIHRIEDFLSAEDKEGIKRRLYSELKQVKSDFDLACEYHGELYEYVTPSQVEKLDNWESALATEVYRIEEAVEDVASNPASMPGTSTSEVKSDIKVSKGESSQVKSTKVSRNNETSDDSLSNNASQPARTKERFDSWIDHLEEFVETSTFKAETLSLSEVLYKLEADRDMPSTRLENFKGDPLEYIDFIDSFKLLVHDKGHLKDSSKLVQLKMHLKGDAEKAVRGLGSQGVMYATALKTLKGQFGHSALIARAYIDRLVKGEKIQDKNLLRALSLDLLNSIAALKQINYLSDINSSDTLRKIVSRFPDRMIHQWKTVSTEARDRGETPDILMISNFLRKRVQAEFDPEFGDLVSSKQKPRGVYVTQAQKIRCKVCNSESHKISECVDFRKMSSTERFQRAKDLRLCFACLGPSHRSHDCWYKKSCGKNGCVRTHHHLLHVDNHVVNTVKHAHEAILPVVRVNFVVNGQVKQGNVLVDSGAGATLIRKEFAKSLGLQGRAERIDLSVVGGEKVQTNSRKLKFRVSKLNGTEEHQIEAYEIGKTALHVPAIDEVWLKSFPHLHDVEIAHSEGPIDLILGVQYSHLHASIETREGQEYEPIARLSRLGWYIMGGDTEKVCETPQVSLVQKLDMEKFYEMETMGIQPSVNCKCVKSLMSEDDKRCMSMFKESCKIQDGRYEMGLPWKDDPMTLPNNYPMAEQRLYSLEKKLSKNAEMAEMYGKAILEYKINGWSDIVTRDDSVKPVYYLPRRGVYKPEKKSTPLRIVFDPASGYNGVSLNSLLYKGPGLHGDLFAILVRFRENQVAFTGDISKMYLQIKLPTRDCQVHRFLWRDMDITKEPDVYQLNRVTFGDKPSPDMANYVMLDMAERHEDRYPEEAVILKKDRYMDDMIHSCDSTVEAERKMKDLDKILASGKFKIKEWICSGNPKSITNIGECENKEQKTVELDGESSLVKTLGLNWSSEKDTLSFNVKSYEQCESLTKRRVLSEMSKVYDPLGLASAVTIKARITMQELWKEKCEWDDQLSLPMVRRWGSLFNELKMLREIEFPRCVRPRNACGKSELHVFVDASLRAYGAVAYVLWPTAEGPEVRIMSAKARVAPVKQTTIPRLELMAALVGSRLAKTLYDELREKPDVVWLWSDSCVVLHWIKSDSASLRQFVGVRIAEIQSTWDQDHWKYVPTNDNPADDLSRGISVLELKGRWMTGPEFMHEPRVTWPGELPDTTLGSETNAESKESKSQKSACTLTISEPVIDCTKFSCWPKLVK